MSQQFLCGELPKDYTLSFEPSLYNTSVHRQLQASTNWESFYLLDIEKKIAQTCIHFHTENQTALSPFNAPFGGIECDEKIDLELLIPFLEFAVGELFHKGLRKLVVKHPSSLQDDGRISRLYLQAGFTIQLNETDSFIRVEGVYEDVLQPRKATKLRSLRKTELIATQLPLEKLSDVYHFILKSRTEKEYTLSMTWQQVEELSQALPQNILLFAVFDHDKMVSASICVKVKSNWLYDFYHDHDPEYDSKSPLLLLMDAIFSFCLKNSIDWLELGTSMHGDAVNKSLLDFKMHLGATTYSKLTFEKILS